MLFSNQMSRHLLVIRETDGLNLKSWQYICVYAEWSVVSNLRKCPHVKPSKVQQPDGDVSLEC